MPTLQRDKVFRYDYRSHIRWNVCSNTLSEKALLSSHDFDSIRSIFRPVYIDKGSQSFQNLVATSQKILLALKAGCKGSNAKNWLLSPGTCSKSEGYSSKWLVWLVCRGTPVDSYNFAAYSKETRSVRGSCMY